MKIFCFTFQEWITHFLPISLLLRLLEWKPISLYVLQKTERIFLATKSLCMRVCVQSNRQKWMIGSIYRRIDGWMDPSTHRWLDGWWMDRLVLIFIWTGIKATYVYKLSGRIPFAWALVTCQVLDTLHTVTCPVKLSRWDTFPMWQSRIKMMHACPSPWSTSSITWDQHRPRFVRLGDWWTLSLSSADPFLLSSLLNMSSFFLAEYVFFLPCCSISLFFHNN